MARPNRLKELENQHGPLEDVIPKLVNELGTQKAAARKLGVSETTINQWLKANDYKLKTIYVKKGEELKCQAS